MTPTLTVGEWRTERAPVSDLTDDDRQLADALRSTDGGRLLIDERRDGVWVTARSWVGIVRFSSFEVRIVPKLVDGNLAVVRMLDYASGIGALRRLKATRTLEVVGENLLELIAWLFADACDRLVADGLLSDYVVREDQLHVLRGRLRIFDQVQRQFGRIDPLEVTFDEFESDIVENQVVTAALDATRAVVRAPELARRVKRLHAIFHEAADPSGLEPLNALREMPYTRRNKHYQPAHLLARLLLQRLAIRDLFSPGGTTSFAFLLDMNELFESFVSRLVASVFEPHGVRVHSQRRDPSIIIDEATGKRYSAIIPDLLLKSRQSPLIRLPADAKYKLYDPRRPDESDVYQTFFYAFAYASDKRGALPARAVILYPRSPDGLDTSLSVNTHTGRQSARIHAFGVDVDAALDAIARDQPIEDRVPAMRRLRHVFAEVAAEARTEERWLAS